MGAVFEQLDYIYEPSADVARDSTYLADVLGARVIFAIEDGGIRVAMVELTAGPPRLLLTDHLEAERPIFIYRVPDLDRVRSQLQSRGWKEERALEIPIGPCSSFTAPGGHRFAIYQLTRPAVAGHFEGRRDF